MISKEGTTMRQALSAGERLAVTLCYLASSMYAVYGAYANISSCVNSRLGTRQYVESMLGIFIDYTPTIEPIAKHERELFGRTLRVM